MTVNIYYDLLYIYKWWYVTHRLAVTNRMCVVWKLWKAYQAQYSSKLSSIWHIHMCGSLKYRKDFPTHLELIALASHNLNLLVLDIIFGNPKLINILSGRVSSIYLHVMVVYYIDKRMQKFNCVFVFSHFNMWQWAVDNDWLLVGIICAW